MKQFFTQNMGVWVLSFYMLVCIVFFTSEFSMIKKLPHFNKPPLSHSDFHVGYYIGELSQEAWHFEKGKNNNIKSKHKRFLPYNKKKNSKSKPTLVSNSEISILLRDIGESKSFYLFGGIYFLFLLPLLIFVGHRSKRTLEERYRSKLLKYSKKLCQLEKEKEDLYSYAISLKMSQKEQSNILEKIYPEQNNFIHIFNELYLCCSKELTENFITQLSKDKGESQKTLISVLIKNLTKNPITEILINSL